jgi:hypothetical protein
VRTLLASLKFGHDRIDHWCLCVEEALEIHAIEMPLGFCDGSLVALRQVF